MIRIQVKNQIVGSLRDFFHQLFVTAFDVYDSFLRYDFFPFLITLAFPLKSCTMRFFIILALFLSTCFNAGAQVSFFPPQNLSNEYGPSNDHNVFAVENHYYLVWDQWGYVMFRHSENGGLSWSNKITLYSGIDYGANYPVVAAANGNVYIFYYRNTTGNSQIFMLKSTNNGQSFGNEIQIGNAIRGAQIPQIAISGDTLVLAYEDRDLNYDYQVFVTTSIDAGLNWSAPTNLSNTTNGAHWCNVALKGEQIFVLYNDQTGPDYDDLDLFFTKSDNFGQNWTTPQNISNNQAYNARLKTRVVDDVIYTIVSSKIDGIQTDAMLYRSDDLGNSWLPAINLSSNAGSSERPDVMVQSNGAGNHCIYAIWSDGSYTSNDQAYLKYSTDNGNSWSEMLAFSQETEDASWPQIIGYRDGDTDQLFMAYFRPNDGTFNYEVWGVRAQNILQQNITFSGQVTDVNENGLANAKITLNGTDYFTNDAGNFEISLLPGTYYCTVSAAGFITFTNPSLQLTQNTNNNFSLEALLFPPLNLHGEIVDQNVQLYWDAPASEGSWLQWDDGINTDAVGGENIDLFDVAIRFTPADLTNYDGFFLTKIAAYFADANCTFHVRVWTGGNQTFAGNLVVDQLVPYPVAGEWNEIELENPVQINANQELWIGYRVQNPNGVYPAGTDAGPAVAFKGDMLLYGSDWVSMSDYFGWDVNWNIKGFAVDAGIEPQSLESINDTPIADQNYQPQIVKQANKGKSFQYLYTYFNVYRNEVLLAEVPASQLSYVDDQPLNENTYYVTSGWEAFESQPSNSVSFNYVKLPENQFQQQFSLSPNPASNNATIIFNLSSADEISIFLTNVSGQQKVIVNRQVFTQGTHSIQLTEKELNEYRVNGLVMVSIKGATQQVTQKLMLN